MRSYISRWCYILLPIIVILLGIQSYHLVVESKNLENDLAKYQTNYKELKKIALNKYIVLNSSSIDYICLSNIPFHPFDFSAFKRIYITEGSIIPFIPYYRLYLEKECKCDMYAYPSFYDYLRTINKDVIMVSTPFRMETIRNYLRETYHYKLPIEEIKTSFVIVQKSEDREDFDDLRVYILKD
jgi:hypothetical protein